MLLWKRRTKITLQAIERPGEFCTACFSTLLPSRYLTGPGARIISRKSLIGAARFEFLRANALSRASFSFWSSAASSLLHEGPSGSHLGPVQPTLRDGRGRANSIRRTHEASNYFAVRLFPFRLKSPTKAGLIVAFIMPFAAA